MDWKLQSKKTPFKNLFYKKANLSYKTQKHILFSHFNVLKKNQKPFLTTGQIPDLQKTNTNFRIHFSKQAKF